MTAMDDVLGYSGRRCIVTGAASGMGEATARILIELGAEVHAVDIRKPVVAGLASYSETDLADPAAIAQTVDAIGAVVNNLFNCAGLPNNFPGMAVMAVNFCGLRELTERVIPNMIDGAANIDPGEFPDAGVVDLDRSGNRHIAFGGGVHRCLGSHLARLEMRVALEELHRRLPDYTIKDGETPVYTMGIRAVEYLPLVFAPAAE